MITIYDNTCGRLSYVCATNCAHFMTFGMRMGSAIWASPWPFHYVEKVGTRGPNNISLLCGEWYWRKLVGHVRCM